MVCKMLRNIMKPLALLVAFILCMQLAIPGTANATQEDYVKTKELNFIYLHGAGGSACSLQLLADSITEQLPAYILDYERENPGTKIRFNTLNRCYPNDVHIETWAKNISESINKYFANKNNLILVGHSMGGKAALYAVAHDIDRLAEKVALVVTINSPIKRLSDYYYAGGGTMLDYWTTQWLISNRGVVQSVAYYDSSKDGNWVGNNKHWLAFISAEAAPASKRFDFGGVDPLPRDMDDAIIPISAQYADGADVIYYGEHGHSDFGVLDKLAKHIADQILCYLFGSGVECSVFARDGTFEHKANWLPVTNYWEDVVGEVLVSSGRLSHTNKSYIKWQEWRDIVGECPLECKRSSFQVSGVGRFTFLTSIVESRWLNVDNLGDCRLYLRTRAIPRGSIELTWSIYRQGLLVPGVKRDHYEVEIVTGTPFTSIEPVSWVTNDLRDLRLQIQSKAEGPFRWFKARWRVYFTETRVRKVIDEIPADVLSGVCMDSQ